LSPLLFQARPRLPRMITDPWRKPDEPHNQRRPGGIRLCRTDLSRPLPGHDPGPDPALGGEPGCRQGTGRVARHRVGTLEQVLADDGRSGGDRHPQRHPCPHRSRGPAGGQARGDRQAVRPGSGRGEGAGRVGGEAAAAAQHLPQPALGRGFPHGAPSAGGGGAGASCPVRIPLRPLSPRGAPALARGGRPGLRSLVRSRPRISSISRSSCSVSRTGCRRIWASSAPGPWRTTTSMWCWVTARCGSFCTAVVWCRP
jgi:hypothetical protein